MKQRNIYWVLAVLLGTACTSTSDRFTIDSHIGGLKDGTVVRLMNLEREEHKGELMATDTVRNGAFQLKGMVASPTRCRVEIVLPRHYEDGTPYEAETATVMMVENVAMAIHAEHVDSLPLTWEYMHSPLEKEMNARVTGGRAQQEYTEYRAALHALELEAWQEGRRLMYWEYDTAKGVLGKQDSIACYKRRQARAAAAVRQAMHEFVQHHPAYAISVELLRRDAARLFTYTPEELDAMAQLASATYDTTRFARLKETIEATKHHARGVPYRDFTLQDEQKTEKRLSDCLRSDVYTLMDFWASWCGPCRAAIPHVKELHERYGDRLDVISVSVDKKESEWLGAVKVEKMPWRQFIVPVDKMKEATEGYQFSSIPTLVVIAPDGTIQFETNEADEIDEFLSRNLN